ncbi:MAG: asparagine synthase (glutamine-hydrolyzing), partial [Thiohalocapsa sp.]
PDGKGEWFSDDGRVALGHRRLSIIDLSERGAQPMASANGKLQITFNGEIYNYRAVRQQLEAKGRVFRSDSDTEVLLHLYAEKGEAMVHDLRGMFAFGLWDAERHALLLARDPYGIKPLYYAADGQTLRFASQVKALRAGGAISNESEPAGIVGFYLFGSVPEPYTLYRGICSLPAGSTLLIDQTGPHAPRGYFSLALVWREAEQAPPADTLHKQDVIRDALLDSVRHHRVADVPVGAFLSAGIDSGALVGLMHEQSATGHPDARHAGTTTGSANHTVQSTTLSTITLAFEEYLGTQSDEGPIAARVAARYGTAHTARVVSRTEFADDLPKILAAMDQPTIDGINTWFVSKAAHEAGLKVAVSGLGGDELFGGYPSFQDIPRWVQKLWLPARIPGLGALAEQVQSLFAPLFASINPKAAGMLRYGGSDTGAYLLKRGLFLPSELAHLMDPDQLRAGLSRLQPMGMLRGTLCAADPAAALGGTNAVPTKPPCTNAPSTPFGRIATLEAAMYMRNQLLRDTDWSSMAHSLEVRVPLVDAWLLRRIAKWLVHSKTPNQKACLANSPRQSLPAEVTGRTKTGFTTPIANWQQQLNSTQIWRKSPLLVRKSCPWARRWSYFVANVV